MKTMFKYGDLVKHVEEAPGVLGVVTKVVDIGLPKFAKSQILTVKWISGNCGKGYPNYYNTSLGLVVRGKNDERV